MIIPILEYANIAWGDKNNKVLMNTIQVLQNKAAKLILQSDLSSRRRMQRCIHMFKLMKDAWGAGALDNQSDCVQIGHIRRIFAM